MGIPILVRRHLYIETAPCSQTVIFRNHFVYASGQWETTLHCTASLIGRAHRQNDLWCCWSFEMPHCSCCSVFDDKIIYTFTSESNLCQFLWYQSVSFSVICTFHNCTDLFCNCLSVCIVWTGNPFCHTESIQAIKIAHKSSQSHQWPI